jgi:hypothetical protein
MKKTNRETTALDAMLDYASAKEWKEILWLWYSSTVTGSYLKETTRSERSDIKVAYEFLHRLFNEINKENSD